jgi:predicted nucleic acid-binding Zn ribbon protein
MSTRRTPRPLGDALERVRIDAGPATLLGAVQSVWAAAVGTAIAAEAEPVAERGGVVTVACRSATWAQELDLLQAKVLARVNEALSRPGPRNLPQTLDGLRFTAHGHRRV